MSRIYATEPLGVKDVIDSWQADKGRIDKISTMSMPKQCKVNMKQTPDKAAENVTTDNNYKVLTYRINVYNTN